LETGAGWIGKRQELDAIRFADVIDLRPRPMEED
jgi:hypothetical protein